MIRADVRRRAMYLAAYTERFGRVPRDTPGFIQTPRTPRTPR